MIQMKIVKWVTAGALAIVAVPAIGMARHSHTVTAAASSALTPLKHTLSTEMTAASSKLVSHKHKKTSASLATHKAKKHRTKHHAKKATTKKHSHKKHSKKKH